MNDSSGKKKGCVRRKHGTMKLNNLSQCFGSILDTLNSIDSDTSLCKINALLGNPEQFVTLKTQPGVKSIQN